MLTFEHVPPRAAFNNFPRFYPPVQEVLANEIEGVPFSGETTHEPDGAGAYTLCLKCNTIRCRRYSLEFIPWAIAWKEALDANPNATQVGLTRRIRRTRIMKQIVAMFLSANPPGFSAERSELRRYVKNTDVVGLPPDIRIFAGLTTTLDARQAGITGYLDLAKGKSAQYSEIAFAPLVLMLTVDSEPVDRRLVEITFMAAGGYNVQEDTTLEFPVLEITTALPGMYVGR